MKFCFNLSREFIRHLLYTGGVFFTIQETLFFLQSEKLVREFHKQNCFIGEEYAGF
jgi:hypothetical protein